MTTMLITSLFNLVLWDYESNKNKRVQLYASSIGNAIKQAEQQYSSHKIIKATEAMFDNERHLY